MTLPWSLLGRSLLLLLASGADLGLGRTTDLLLSVLQFLNLFATCLLLLDHAMSGQSVLGLVLLRTVHVVIDEGEADGFVATEERVEPEGEDDVGGRLVHLGQLVADLGLGHRRATWMQNIHYHLFPVKETVGHKLPRSDGDRAFFCMFYFLREKFLTE